MRSPRASVGCGRCADAGMSASVAVNTVTQAMKTGRFFIRAILPFKSKTNRLYVHRKIAERPSFESLRARSMRLRLADDGLCLARRLRDAKDRERQETNQGHRRR